MELINLDHCATNDQESILKKESLKAFILKNENYNVELLLAALDVNRVTLIKWIKEINRLPLENFKERIVKMKLKHPALTQRQIAINIGCSLGSVNKALKKLT
jgi:hypothetical protein